MRSKAARSRRLSLSLLVPFGWTTGINCAGHTGVAKSAAVSIRFAIEVESDSPGPIYVLLNGSDAQVGWVTVYREGERIYFRERCEIADCGVPAAVCGAAFPEVRNIAGNGDRRSIEFVWDGMTSVRDSLSGCEIRRPASPGQYTARFCYSHEAELEGDGDPLRAASGRLIDATCLEKPFTLLEREIVLRI